MKSKNIPDDIRSKSIKEAQKEIEEIIASLENTDADLEKSIEQYNRMMHLNFYIQEQFKKKANEIKKTNLQKKWQKLFQRFNMANFSGKLNKIARSTDAYLKSVFAKQDRNSFLIRPMKYSLLSGGKRFRSSIVVNTGKIFDIDYKKLIIIGSAIECIHSYSLIHDDLPAMDNDDLRRGKPATHKKFNEFTAILAGNSLLALAFEILSSKKLNFPARVKNELIKTLAVYSGSSGLAGGQYFDLTYENKKVSKKKIIDMQINKTGKLFAFCCESAGIIKELNYKKRNMLKKLGLDIGLLFQVTDDLIDHKGDAKIVGKPTRRDKSKGKQTLVNLIGYKNTLDFVNNLKKKISIKIKKYGIKSDDLLQSVEFILDRKF